MPILLSHFKDFYMVALEGIMEVLSTFDRLKCRTRKDCVQNFSSLGHRKPIERRAQRFATSLTTDRSSLIKVYTNNSGTLGSCDLNTTRAMLRNFNIMSNS